MGRGWCHFIEMDSLASSTNCTLSLQFASLQQWALRIVAQGRKADLQNLLAVLPTIQELNSYGLSIEHINEIELHDLDMLANLKDDLIVETENVRQFNEFRDNQSSYANIASKVNMDLQLGFLSENQLEVMGHQLQAYLTNFGRNVFKYLKVAGATKYQQNALAYYLELQFQTVKEYLRFQLLTFMTIKLNFAKSHALGASKPEKQVKEQKKQKEICYRKHTNQDPTVKKGQRGEKLKTEYTPMKTDRTTKKTERSSTMKSLRLSAQPEKRQNRGRPNKL